MLGNGSENASAGNRTRVTSMAAMYSTTRPLMLYAYVKKQKNIIVRKHQENGCYGHISLRSAHRGQSLLKACVLQITNTVHDFIFRGSIVVSTSACHAEDPGSIPGRGVLFHLHIILLF